MIGMLPETWAAAKLSDICQINPRGKSGLKEDDEVSFVPMAAVSEFSGTIVGAETRTLREVQKGFTPFQEGDVLFAKITPCMENGKAAIARNLVNQRGYGSTEFHVMRPSALVLADWIFAIIRTPEFRRAAASSFQGAVGQQRVTASFLECFRIPLPPLSEQQRIVEILQEAEAIRRLRAEAEAKTAELIPAIFSNAFLLPAICSTWKETTVADIAAKSDNAIRTGPFGSDLLHSEFVDDGIPVLGIDNAVANRFRWSERRYITPAKYFEFGRFRVFPNDVMITIMGTVGRVAIAPTDLPEAISSKHLCVITPDTEQILPSFLWATLLHNPLVRSQTKAVGKGAIMEGWNSKIIRRLKFHLPPLSLQREFDAQVKGVLETEDALLAATSETALNASLSAHAFSGQLTADWRGAHADQLALEARERDAALKQAGATLSLSRRATIQQTERIFEQRTDGIYSDLNREQRFLLAEIKRMVGGVDYGRYFTAEQLADYVDGPLHRNPQAINSHLQVFSLRGLIIPLSRRKKDPANFIFGACFRLPLPQVNTDDKEGGEHQSPYPQGDDVKAEFMEAQHRLATGNI
jgi:type I restriction enzyme S subunit